MVAPELIEHLQGLDPESEIRLVSLPFWPLEYSIAGTSTPQMIVTSAGTVAHDHEEHDCEICSAGPLMPKGGREAGVLFLLEGTQLGYGTKDAWNG